MKTHAPVAPRTAILVLDPSSPVPARRRARRLAAVVGAGFAVALALGGCNTPAAGSAIPGTSIAVPSIDPSAAASLGTQIGLAALGQVDAAIAANTSATGLTADEASSLTQLTAGLRTALQSGDMTAAKTAVTDLSMKVDSFAAKLSGPEGTQLTAAVAALKAAIGA